MTNFGEIIKKRRNLLKLTQQDLSEMSNVTERTIYKIENGIGSVTFETMQKLCDVLGLEIDIKAKKS
jgi:y4mF family transcriptional regulator